MSFTIITERIGDDGILYSQEFRCKEWHGTGGVISFYTENGDYRLISIHKMDNILIKKDMEVNPDGS